MMWIRLRSPKMNGAIFGFQKRVWCPKWTPASSICRMDMLAMVKVSLWGWASTYPMRQPARPLGRGRHPAACDDTCADLVEKKGRALYHNFPFLQTLGVARARAP